MPGHVALYYNEINRRPNSQTLMERMHVLHTFLEVYHKPWRTLVTGDEQLYRPCGKSSQEMRFLQLKPKTFIFMDLVAY